LARLKLKKDRRNPTSDDAIQESIFIIDLNFVLAGFFALRSSSACSGIRASEFKTN
jgi:hypothetical protein